MKHLATIQAGFLKEAREWNKLSLDEQRAYLKKHPKSKKRLTRSGMHVSENKQKDVSEQSLDDVISMIWDGDVSTKEAITNVDLTAKDVEIMKNAIHENIKFFKDQDGVPFPGDNKQYDELIKTNKGIKLLQKLIDAND